MIGSRRDRHPSAAGPLVRFHLRVGARLALRRLGPVLTGFLFLLVFLRIELFFLIITELGRSGGVFLGGVLAAIGWICAAAAAPRIVLGLSGWIRHLPATSGTQRRADLAGLWISLFPVLLLMGLLTGLAGGLKISFFLGLPLLGWAAGTASLNLSHKHIVRPLALLAAVLSVSGSWIFLGGSVALVVLSDRLSGEIVRVKKPRLASSPLKIWGLHFLILWRSLRWRLGLSYLLALLPFLATYVFLANNPLSPLQAGRARLFGCALTVVIFQAFAAGAVAARRPAWPWIRSLPLSARRRFFLDAVFLCGHSLPFLVPLAARGDMALFFIGLSLPVFSLKAAAELRRAPASKSSAFGPVLLYGFLGGVLVTVFPWVSAAYVGMIPLLLRQGAQIEQECKVSRWMEFHHLAAGDPHSWSQE